MALFLASHPSFLIRNPKPLHLFSIPSSNHSLSISTNPNFSSFRIHSSLSDEESNLDPLSRQIPINKPKESDEKSSPKIVDEWGEKSEPESESSFTKLSDADPPKDEYEDEYEWGEGGGEEQSGGGEIYRDDGFVSENGSAAPSTYDKLGELKRSVVDTFYGTELGFKASAEVRAEVFELVNQLESLNPTPVPTEAPSLDGNWVLLYTAFSELLPLLAAGATPLLKIKRICQSIDTRNLTIENSITLSSPFASFSFSATATFEVRSPSRIQVKFMEGTLKPPEISSSLSLPENLDIFGQKIDLSPVQRSLNPLEEGVANISRAISGQPPLKVPIPGDRSSSWLLTTYLDEDFRISRGDGGLFILAKEGSPLLDQ